jgi:hypothetical protein
MKGPRWSRLAAATGILFAVTLGAAAALGEMKDIALAGDLARATNEVFGTVSILFGFSAVFLYWFTATFAARLRQLEGGSGRLAAAVNGSGSFISGSIALAVGVVFAARNYGGADIAPVASAILDGPALLFPAAVYVAAAGVVGVRADGLPILSRVLSRVGVLLGATYLTFAGLQIFFNYAWINDTAYITFALWVLAVSAIGVSRWTEMDARPGDPPAPVAAVRKPERAVPVLRPLEEDDEEPRTSPRKAPARKKPAARKTVARKTTARKKAAVADRGDRQVDLGD